MQNIRDRSKNPLPPFCAPAILDRRAFTLVELLAVIGIIVIMFGLAVPAINGMKSSGDVSKSVYDIAGILDQARAYAMGNSTYVYVGIQEVDASIKDSAPQKAGVGRVAIAVMASKDGTAPTVFDPTTVTPLQKIQRIDNLHLADFYGKTATTGPMVARNAKLTDKTYSLGYANPNAVTVFTWPLSGTAQYSFSKVIRFSPQGVATLSQTTDTPPYIEIGLRQTKGNVLTPTDDKISDLSTTNLAAIQIDGIIGSNRIFRP